MSGALPRVLLVTPNYEDYLSDAVLHGLRALIGENVVDFPKAEAMYRDAPAEVRARVRGGGFTLYGLLDDVPLARDQVFDRALGGEFDLVIFGDIWRSFGLWTQWGPQLARASVRLAVLDGADRVEPYPYSGLWWRVRGWWFLPAPTTAPGTSSANARGGHRGLPPTCSRHPPLGVASVCCRSPSRSPRRRSACSHRPS